MASCAGCNISLGWKKYNFQFDNISVSWGPSNLTELKDVGKNEKDYSLLLKHPL